MRYAQILKTGRVQCPDNTALDRLSRDPQQCTDAYVFCLDRRACQARRRGGRERPMCNLIGGAQTLMAADGVMSLSRHENPYAAVYRIDRSPGPCTLRRQLRTLG